ncbi:MAG TPA: universal stress protein [Chloroflexota bacterium]
MAPEGTVVVAVEDAATAGSVAAGAVRVAIEHGATQLILVHVLDEHPLANALYQGGGLSVPAPAPPIDETPGEVEQIFTAAEAAIRAACRTQEAPLPAITRWVGEGRPTGAIIARVAADTSAVAIVVGARRPHALGRLVHPDACAALRHHTHTPIRVVSLRGEPHTPAESKTDEHTRPAANTGQGR